MSVQQGMDVRAVRASARELSRYAGDVDSLVSQATRAIGKLESTWEGNDFVSFKSTWDGSTKTALSRISEDLRSTSRELNRQADGQEGVSEDYEGGTEGGSPTAGDGSSGSTSSATGGDDKKTPEPQIDPGHSESPGNPYDSGNTRTPLSDGGTMITDKDGNVWYEDTTGKVYPQGTAIRFDKDGNPVGVDYGSGRWENKDGPGGTERSSRVYSERDGWQQRQGATHDWSRNHDTAYTRWKMDDARPWNQEGSLAQVPGQVSDWADRHNVSGEIKNDLVKAETGAEWEGALASKQWGDDKNGVRVEALSARAEANAEAGIGPTGASATATAAAGGYLARASGQFQSGEWNGMSAKGSGSAYAGAEAKVGGEASIGPGGAKVGVNAEAFAGAKMEGDVTGKIGPAEVTAGGELSVGIGAHADIDGEISMEKVDVSVDIGATLGIGGGVKFDISFSPKEALDLLPDLF